MKAIIFIHPSLVKGAIHSMKTKKKFKWLKIIRNIMLFVVAVLLIVMSGNSVMTMYEHKQYPAWGQYVEVKGKKMHVYTKGTKGRTIVMLPGLGTAAPVLDYEPLLNELAKQNKVVVVEPFGYGWSDLTNEERTVDNIVGELRSALQQADIPGPYTLLSHSASGIYSVYYANKYPDEIEAIAGIDITLPQAVEYFKESVPGIPAYMSLIAPSGAARLVTYINPSDFLPKADEGTYSDENIKLTKMITAWKAYNKDVVKEANEMEHNINATKEMTLPPNLPVIIFTPKIDKVTEDGKSNITFYEEQLKNVRTHQLIVLKGHHYLHWTHYKKIADDVNAFLSASLAHPF
ncbi:Pimeloyl-ACP methyl ester carboxylesterase [Paenibacillus jilunlii]|uniref:Pimeloyl-ACP methyl ester carboxylesterase n=2 Tax=Paenibacillus jilunlii TaxID=682956 RepID=A0A1G9J0P2_9BACL|nr:Pimeloyl-ACP methyl ester carboxylesterase [Paenibacillus jilunlii]